MEQTGSAAQLDRLLTPQDVAEWLQVSPKSIYDYCSRSKFGLPHLRIGGHLRFRRHDIEEWLDANVNRCA